LDGHLPPPLYARSREAVQRQRPASRGGFRDLPRVTTPKENEMESNASSKTHNAMQPLRSQSGREQPKDEVRSRAYQLYISRNREPGHALDDWLQAERELNNN
jgi:hypothetical protein